MPQVLLISVRLHEGRFHGEGDRPPSPARLFQALVAGSGIAGPLSEGEIEALRWLERCNPPVICAPRLEKGQSFTNYVPSNDLDAKQGDPRRIAEVRTRKDIQPMLFDAQVPFLYAWTHEPTEDSRNHVGIIRAMAERLYQFGRGVDMAWAWGEELFSEAEIEQRLMDYPGPIYRPSERAAASLLPCPQVGSLESLMVRYRANARRFAVKKSGRSRVTQHFSQLPKPRFRQVAYDSPPIRQVYELREHSSGAPFAAWPLDRTAKLVEELRDEAAARLRKALPAKSREIEHVLIGRKTNGADASPTSQRVRIIPLPSIGHHHADRGIRRVLVEVPAGCSLRADDVSWAFARQEIDHAVYGKSIDVTRTESDDMLKHYGVDECFRVWRTVTPLALPSFASRRRIDPSRIAMQAKDGSERLAEQERAAASVFQALRHAEVRCRPDEIRVQREPFEVNGERVEAFAMDTRFSKERLWHVEVCFSEPVPGPLVIGDGRFLGLGVMVPNRTLE